ncbi:TonB-dependent receptor [Sphingobacterium alkalisoli]|uniref:TonB-dependent receptor n=1 Tax=Sphingobacterium alkalisoli TaxID=1874115 RepID=A0A4U0H4Z6_9SPHI|nr:SusC/RagA family TonB-linked outer membrane protein [Sphingobacterium alkalisoli]TJY66803.1 TonB-dependent receptor [Sphingobacterium alkalisoli]
MYKLLLIINNHLSRSSIRIFCSTLFFLLWLTTGGICFGQQNTITATFKQTSIKEVFRELNETMGLKFMYSTKDLNEKRTITATFTNASVQSVLNRVLQDLDVSYTLKDNTVIIKRKSRTENIKSQDRVIRGQVLDENAQALPNVTVSTNLGKVQVSTDSQGNFSLPVTGSATSLSFRTLGYESKEVALGDQEDYTVKLSKTYMDLNEVVVVGYGVQKRKDMTGAVSSVSGTQLNKVPSTSLNEMLRGAAPGIQVTTANASPGGSSSILIRGRRSLSAGNDPLYIVDGIPTASIDDINPNEIESVEILKDASSQSIYGARAANGVILVTTKRGLSNTTKINVNSYVGNQSLDRNFEFYDGEQWAAYRKEAFYNANGYYEEDEVFRGLMGQVYQSKDYVNWEEVMLNSAVQNKNDVLIQSGSDKTKYALSVGHLFQDGMVPGSDFTRFTGRLNVDQKLFDKVTLGSNIAYTKSFRNIADGSFNSYITMPPLAQIYNTDGSLRQDVTEAGESHFNPLWNIDHSENISVTDRFNLNLFADWNISESLSFRVNGSLNNRKVQDNVYRGILHSTGRNNQGEAEVSESTYNDYLVENILNYNKDIDKHHIDATAMQSINVIQWKRLANTGFGFANDDLSYQAIASASTHGIPVYELSDRRLLSYMGRVRYNYDSRYILSLAMRIDGSSVFGANNKYGYFPSAAFAWRIKDETFLKDVSAVSDLKLRLSYGQVGNQGISPYTTLGLADKYLTEFGNVTQIGYLPNAQLQNPNLKWETSTSVNLGLDYGFLRGRINGTLEFYDTQTTDLLVERSLSSTLGYTSQLVNLGHVQNRGVEIGLNTIPVETTDFKWNLGINFTLNRNKIKKIDGQTNADGTQTDDINNRWFIGNSMNVYYDYEFDGIWQLDDDIANSAMKDAKPGAVRVKDNNADNVISVDDRIIINRDPKWIGSLITGFEYKGFNLTADLYYVRGGYLYNSYLTSFESGGDLTGKRNGIRRNYWTIHNPSQEAPAPNMNQTPAFLSAAAYQKATYIRLRNLGLSYNIPKKYLEKIKLDNLRVFGTMTNVWTSTEVMAYGPEQNPGQYPEPKTMLFGLNFSF